MMYHLDDLRSLMSLKNSSNLLCLLSSLGLNDKAKYIADKTIEMQTNKTINATARRYNSEHVCCVESVDFVNRRYEHQLVHFHKQSDVVAERHDDKSLLDYPL